MQIKIKSMFLFDFLYVLVFPTCFSLLVNAFFREGGCRLEAVACIIKHFKVDSYLIFVLNPM